MLLMILFVAGGSASAGVVVENPGSVNGASAARLYYPSGISGPIGATTMSAGFTQALGDVEWLSRAVAESGYVVLGLTPNNKFGMVSGWKNMHKGGIAKLQQLNSSHNVLRGKIDLSKLQTCGHSKGGGGSLWASSELRDSLRTTIGMAPYREEFSNNALGSITAATFIQAGGADTLANNSMTRGEFSGLGQISKMYVEYSGYDHLAWTTTHAARAGRISGDIVAWMKYYMDGDTSHAGALSNKTGTQRYDWVDLGAPKDNSTGGDNANPGGDSPNPGGDSPNPGGDSPNPGGDSPNPANAAGCGGGNAAPNTAANTGGCGDGTAANSGNTGNFNNFDNTGNTSNTGDFGDPVDIDDGYHQQRMQFVNMSNGNYLTAKNGSSGAAVIDEGESSLRGQWVLRKAGNDSYQIINVFSGNVLAPKGNTATSGTAIVAAGSSSGNAQYWKLTAAQRDAVSNTLAYTIVNANTGLAVTLKNGAYVLSANNKSAGQQFLFNAYGAEGFAGYCTGSNNGKVASITGGVFGDVVKASSVSQLQNYAAGATPYTIVIDRNISTSALTKVNVGQNKTFIGSYSQNILNNIHFRCISNSGNVIFKNITFNHDSSKNRNDDIQMYISTGNKFWIDHCTFTGHPNPGLNAVDKFIYVGANNFSSEPPADFVSVTGCRFGGHTYGLILGYPDDDYPRFAGYPRMTIANSFSDGTLHRAAGLMRYGYFHSYNNYVYDYGYAYTAYNRANVYSENNYFDRGSHAGTVLDPGPAGARDRGFTDSGSVLPPGDTSVSRTSVPKTSWRPSTNYDYNVRPAKDVPAWCKRNSGAQSSKIVYSVDDFDNDTNGPIVDNNSSDNSGVFNGGNFNSDNNTDNSGIFNGGIFNRDNTSDNSGVFNGANNNSNAADTGNVTNRNFNGTYSIVAAHSGKAMDTWEWGTTNGTNIVQYDYWAGDAQKFIVAPVDGIWHRITPLIASNQAVSVADCSSNAGANIYTYAFTQAYANCQQFRFQDAGNGKYQIIARSSNMCVEVANGAFDDGANIIQNSCQNGADNQLFEMISQY